MSYGIRKATVDDIPALKVLIAESARGLAKNDYRAEQIEGALGSAWGVDTQLLRDETYFVVEAENGIVACGGWSKRKTLFGGDALAGREPALLDPATEAARIRAFFVHPDFARCGLGRTLLTHCEEEARTYGFRAAELVATLPGERLYRRFGYIEQSRKDYPLPNGHSILFITMKKNELGTVSKS